MTLHLEKQSISCGMMSRVARHIAADENTGKLAVVRKSRSPESSPHDYIEFYNILSGWLSVPELTICPENGSIEHVLFVENGELMTSHANGSVCFLDPHNATRVKRCQISASTVWAACPHGKNTSTIALISHSSVLYFFDTHQKVIISSVSLGVESRLFDVSSNGSLVAIGSIDGVLLSDNRKVVRTLKLDRQNRRDPTIAWTVLFVADDLLACGDSRGTVTLWNPNDGALVQTISVLQSHVLTMCFTRGALNVAGVDPRVTALKQLQDGLFEVTNRRAGHVRDVRSLAVYDQTIYSAGEDFDIFVSRSGQSTRKMLIQHAGKHVQVAGEMVGSGSENYVDVHWKQPGEDEPADGSNTLTQHYEMIHLARVFSPKKRVITCWKLSKNGEYLVMGTSADTSVYKFTPKAAKLSKKVQKIATIDLIPTALTITDDLKVFSAKSDFEIVEFDILAKDVQLRSVISQPDCGSVIKLSSSAKNVSVLTTRSQVFSINTETADCRLVKVELPIDILSTGQNSLFVLSSVPQDAENNNSDAKKILFEVTNGSVKRSASAHQLRMVPNSPKSEISGHPTALYAIGDSRIMVVSYEGHWSIVDLDSSTVISALDGPLKAKKPCVSGLKRANASVSVCGIRQMEEEPLATPKAGRTRKSSLKNDSFAPIKSRLIQLEVQADELPKTAGFRLKKFGMQ